MLVETIKLMEAKNPSIAKMWAYVWTEIIRCEECEFPAETMQDLVDHMHELHALIAHPGIYFIYFIEGKCDFMDLFRHDQSKTLTEYEYRICQKKSKVQFAFMKHRKEEHEKYIPSSDYWMHALFVILLICILWIFAFAIGPVVQESVNALSLVINPSLSQID